MATERARRPRSRSGWVLPTFTHLVILWLFMPIFGGDSFACAMNFDLTMKGQGRTQMGEICVYDVKDGSLREVLP